MHLYHTNMLSREGFTIDVVALALRKYLLDPAILIPIWLVLSVAPSAITLGPQSGSVLRVLQLGARILAIIGTTLALNDFLTTQFNNNWTGPSKWNWDQEIVLITGGSSGIGQSLSQQLLKRNPQTRVIIADIVPLSWKAPEHSRVHFYRCDLSSEAEIKAFCAQIRKEVGHPTVVVNNAGLVRGFTVCDGTYADVQLTIRTNLVAPFLLVKEFLPDMVKKNHGHILSISSMSAFIPPAGVADYAATKAGLIALHEVRTALINTRATLMAKQALQLELINANASRVRLSTAVLSFVQTPLFKGETKQSNFLTPLLDVDSVGERLAQTLYSGYGRTIFLPGMMRYIACLVSNIEPRVCFD